MKPVIFFLAILSTTFTTSCNNSSAEEVLASNKKNIATCYGYTPCNACSNCSLCKHCKAGGTCGVCVPSKKDKPKSYKAPAPSSSGRCQATTKKGTQCSRNSRSGGYCWQHGG